MFILLDADDYMSEESPEPFARKFDTLREALRKGVDRDPEITRNWSEETLRETFTRNNGDGGPVKYIINTVTLEVIAF